jgi:hypothetical protein
LERLRISGPSGIPAEAEVAAAPGLLLHRHRQRAVLRLQRRQRRLGLLPVDVQHPEARRRARGDPDVRLGVRRHHARTFAGSAEASFSPCSVSGALDRGFSGKTEIPRAA